MSIYGLGALSRYGNENMKVILTIVQPRAKNPIRSWETTAENLVDWGFDVLKPALDLCEAEEPVFVYGKEHCRFCPAKKFVKLINTTQEDKMSDEVKQEPLLTLDGKDYFEADFDENSLKILNMAKFAAQQVNDFNNKSAMAQDHQQNWSKNYKPC